MPEQPTIAAVNLVGIYGHQTVRLRFTSGLNVVYGKNGSGKTTMLHVLANLFDRDIERFCRLQFQFITVSLNTGTKLTLRRTQRQSKPSVEVALDDRVVETVEQGSARSEALDVILEEHLGGRP